MDDDTILRELKEVSAKEGDGTRFLQRYSDKDIEVLEHRSECEVLYEGVCTICGETCKGVGDHEMPRMCY